jgi:hypothetical protein
MIYIPKYFKIEEILPQDLCDPQDANQWFMFDNRILMTADKLRERYGQMICNTWSWNGDHQYRGFRGLACSVGSTLSQHKFGRALDLIPTEVTVDEVRNEIIANPFKEEFKFITAIESGVHWLHIDCRNYDKARNGLLIFGSQ